MPYLLEAVSIICEPMAYSIDSHIMGIGAGKVHVSLRTALVRPVANVLEQPK